MFALQSNIGFVFTAFSCLANSLQKPGFQTGCQGVWEVKRFIPVFTQMNHEM